VQAQIEDQVVVEILTYCVTRLARNPSAASSSLVGLDPQHADVDAQHGAGGLSGAPCSSRSSTLATKMSLSSVAAPGRC
jgi:hypothetical protein